MSSLLVINRNFFYISPVNFVLSKSISFLIFSRCWRFWFFKSLNYVRKSRQFFKIILLIFVSRVVIYTVYNIFRVFSKNFSVNSPRIFYSFKYCFYCNIIFIISIFFIIFFLGILLSTGNFLLLVYLIPVLRTKLWLVYKW